MLASVVAQRLSLVAQAARPSQRSLKIPKLRQGSCFPEFLEPRRTAEKTLTAVIQEAYVQGIPARSVDALVKATGMSGVSKRRASDRMSTLPFRLPPKSCGHAAPGALQWVGL